MLFTVVVPLESGDSHWSALSERLRVLPLGTEILFAGREMPREAPAALASLAGTGKKVRWIPASGARAALLNAAALEAQGEFLWFLLSRSRVDKERLGSLEKSIARAPLALHFFQPSPLERGLLARLHSWSRKRVSLEQGVCLARDLFDRIGGFPENEAGPDQEAMLLLREALSNGLRIRGVK